MKKRQMHFSLRRITTEKVYGGTISAADLKLKLGIPQHAKVWVDVPSGGDYSGTQLDLNEASIHVLWSEKADR